MDTSTMRTITQAAQALRTVRMTYTDAKGVSTVRTVEPYEFKGDKLYAYCVQKDGIRAFDINRVSHVHITDETFDPRFEVKIG